MKGQSKSVHFYSRKCIWNSTVVCEMAALLSRSQCINTLWLSWTKCVKDFCYNRFCLSWWRHEMETYSVLLVICAGNSPVPGEYPTQMPVTRSLDVFFDLRLNKRLGKQWWGWWFETLSHQLWRHRNVIRCILDAKWSPEPTPGYRQLGPCHVYWILLHVE